MKKVFFNDPPGPEKNIIEAMFTVKISSRHLAKFHLQPSTTETKTNRDKWLGLHHTGNAISNHEKEFFC